jgi:hypothetical protein
MSLKIPSRILCHPKSEPLFRGPPLAGVTVFEHTSALVTTDPEKGKTDDVAGPAQPSEVAALRATSPVAPAAPHSSDSSDDRRDPDAVAPAPEPVLELAAACVRFVGARYAVALDFAPETLSLVDQWLRDARAEQTKGPEIVELVQGAAGAYLGEVIRRAFGGSWVLRPERADWKLCLSRVYCCFNPLGMAREAVLLEPAEGWHAHVEVDPGEEEAVEERLAVLPPVEDDDYYAPSTRFDVIAILFDALLEGMRARGLSDVRFTPDDYA